MVASAVFAVLLAVGLAASANREDQLDFGKVAHSKDDAYYDFRYAVDDEQSGVVADRWESRSGRFVKGAYSLLDPDGKVRTVHYEVDGDKGFKAIVRTATPSQKLLSIQSASRSRQEHGDPPVNKVLVQPPLLTYGAKPFNYHALAPLRPAPAPQAAVFSQPPLQSPSSSALASGYAFESDLPNQGSPVAYKRGLFADEFNPQPEINVENLQSLQDLTPPAIDSYPQSYDFYPGPARTPPNRAFRQPPQDSHRTAYSDYVNRELLRVTPLRSTAIRARDRRLVTPPAGRGDGHLLRKKIVLAPLDSAPASRQLAKPLNYFTGTSSRTPSQPSSPSSYFL